MKMFNISSRDAPTSKFFSSRGALPQFVDPKQPPSKRKPFATILNQPINHTVEGHITMKAPGKLAEA